MMKPNEAKAAASGTEVKSPKDVYTEFISNWIDRLGYDKDALIDQMTKETDSAKITEFSARIKEIMYQVEILNHLHDGKLAPLQVEDIINGTATPEVNRLLKPIFGVLNDLRSSLDLFGRF